MKNGARLRQKLRGRDGSRCWLCRRRMSFSSDPKYAEWAATIDHVIPRSHGGTNAQSNLRLAHRMCNLGRKKELEFPIWAVLPHPAFPTVTNS